MSLLPFLLVHFALCPDQQKDDFAFVYTCKECPCPLEVGKDLHSVLKAIGFSSLIAACDCWFLSHRVTLLWICFLETPF